jgi:hypothetical protein
MQTEDRNKQTNIEREEKKGKQTKERERRIRTKKKLRGRITELMKKL